jgi:uncharacterized protein
MMTTLPINARLARLGAVVAGFALALTTPGTSAHAAGDTVAANKATITRSFEAWAAGTGGPYDLLADDVQWTIPGRSAVARTYPSREAFLGEVIRPFNARMRQPLKPVLRDVRGEGDAVIVLFDASSIATDGIAYSNTYSWHLRLRGQRIIAATAFFDSIAFDEMWKRVPAPTREAVR